MNLRSNLLTLVRWKLGNGVDCTTYGQPWFAGAVQQIPNEAQMKNILVKDLVDESTGQWDVQLLIQLFGYTRSMVILATVQVPTGGEQRDTLIFNLSSNGGFTVKLAYDHLSQMNRVPNRFAAPTWECVWSKGSMVPRVRLFLWRLLNNALPLGTILVSRGIRADISCAMCVDMYEDITHMLFLCSFARACWFSSNAGIRSHQFTVPIQEIILSIANSVPEADWTYFANVTWAIWRCRNDATYGGKIPEVTTFSKYLHSISVETDIALTSGNGKRQINNMQNTEPLEISCYVDRSVG